MPTLIIETEINAAPEICFDLIRQASAETNRQVTAGDFASGQTVIFENSFFGFKQNLTVKVSEFNRPELFVDEMTTGNFKTFRHIHEFVLQNNSRTLLKDTFEWSSLFGILGRIADGIFLKKRLRKVVERRNRRLKQIAENLTK